MTTIQPIAAPQAPASDPQASPPSSGGDGFGAALAKARGADNSTPATPAGAQASTAQPTNAAAAAKPSAQGGTAQGGTAQGATAQGATAQDAATGGAAQRGQTGQGNASAKAAAAQLLAAQLGGDGATLAAQVAALAHGAAAPGTSLAQVASGSVQTAESTQAASGMGASGQIAVDHAGAAAAAVAAAGMAVAVQGGKNLPPAASDAAPVLGDATSAAGGGAQPGSAPPAAASTKAANPAVPPALQAALETPAVATAATAAHAAAHAHQADATAVQQLAQANAALSGASTPNGASVAPAATSSSAALQQPVGSPGWGQELGQQMLFAVGSQQQLASLKLNPPQLGPLEVHLQLDNGQINAQFVSPHQAVRQALESAMPQLHDMFSNAGMSLAQASVNSGGGRGERNLFQRQSRSSTGAAGAIGAVDDAAGATPELRVRSANGLVNTYV
jgi:flagellar hook-length control protein FliK